MRRWLIAMMLLLVSSVGNADCGDEGSQPGMFTFNDDAAVATFLRTLQAGVKAQDKSAVASLVSFPIRVHVDGKIVSIGQAGFVANFDQIFTAKVKAAHDDAKFVSQKDWHCVFWNAQGMMVGNGELWFDQVTDRSIKVTAINN